MPDYIRYLSFVFKGKFQLNYVTQTFLQLRVSQWSKTDCDKILNRYQLLGSAAHCDTSLWTLLD